MIPDKILYTDGHDVIVTDSTFQVKRNSYNLNGITKHGMFILKPQRMPAILLLLVGLSLVLVGLFNFIPASMEKDFYVGAYVVNTTTLAICIGGLLALVGIFIVGLVKERYAVRIATAEGEKNAVISTRKEYISQILDALNKAYNFLRLPRKGTYKSTL